MTARSTQRLFEKLAKVGLKRDYVQRMLPAWASEGALDDAAVLPELKLAIARRFGLDAQALLDEAGEVRWQTASPARYKRSKRLKESQLDLATAVSVSAARVATAAVAVPFVRPPANGLEARQTIKDRYKPKFVSFGAVLMYAWDSGIPVLFVSELPEGAPKMDALSVSHKGRPAIVVSKSVRYSAWLSFIVAHELGHIALGHLSADDLIVDDEISGESYLAENEDAEESAADAFAIELLNGAADRRYQAGRHLNPRELANAAMRLQRSEGIDAGHVVLNYGHGAGQWDIAMAALNLIDKDDARTLLQGALRERISQESLSPDSLDYLLRIAGGGTPET